MGPFESFFQRVYCRQWSISCYFSSTDILQYSFERLINLRLWCLHNTTFCNILSLKDTDAMKTYRLGRHPCSTGLSPKFPSSTAESSPNQLLWSCPWSKSGLWLAVKDQGHICWTWTCFLCFQALTVWLGSTHVFNNYINRESWGVVDGSESPKYFITVCFLSFHCVPFSVFSCYICHNTSIMLVFI